MKNDNLNEHKHIAFVEDHYNPLGLIRSLGEKGIKTIVILVGEKQVLIPACKYVRHIHYAKSIEVGFDVLIKEYGNEELKPFLYTCNDNITSFLDKRYSILKDKFYFFNGGSEGHITNLMNKDAINRLAIKCGCLIPKEEVVDKGILPATLHYPVMTKAIDSLASGWKSDSFICHNEKELKDAFTQIKSSKVLVQEFIVKKNELCLDGFSFNEGNDVFIPYQTSYIRFTPQSYGNYMYIKPMCEEAVYQQIRNILKEAQFTGVFSVEYLVDQSDNFHFLEVNFRNSTWSYAFTKGGCNLPYLWAKSMLTGRISEEDYHVNPKQFTAMVELADFSDSVKNGNTSLFQWIKDIYNCDCLFLWNKRDKDPFFAELKYRALRKLKRLF